MESLQQENEGNSTSRRFNQPSNKHGVTLLGLAASALCECPSEPHGKWLWVKSHSRCSPKLRAALFRNYHRYRDATTGSGTLELQKDGA